MRPAVRFRLQLAEIPEIPGEVLLNQPDVISSSSKIRSTVRLTVLQFNVNMSNRGAVDKNIDHFVNAQ